MKQLAGIDNFFLKSETGQVYNHVASLGIYDPSTAPSGKVRFKEILEHFKKRLHVSPVFTSRLVTPPLGMDRPYWIGDPKIDVEFHIRHIALPKPGDWRQLMIQVARLHSRSLDKSKPLWEAYIIEGLNHVPGIVPGSFALYIKFHHAAVDGEGGAIVISSAMDRLKKISEFSKSKKHHHKNKFRKPKIEKEKKEEPKIATHKQTLHLLLSGLTVEETAQKRELAKSTVFGHIAKLIKSGELDGNKYIDENKLNNIRKLYPNYQTSQTIVTDIKGRLSEEYTFEDVRLACAILEKEKKM